MKLLFALFTMIWTSLAFAGPESGGGGNVCEVPGLVYGTNLVALDVAGVKLANGFRLGLLGVQRVSLNDVKTGMKVITPSHPLVKGVEIATNDLRAMGADGKRAADQIVSSMRDLKMLVVAKLPSSRPLAADFTDARACNASNTHGAILYDWKTGIVISQEIWNRLDSTTQVVLLVHEALRNIQIRYRLGFTNLTLQRLTMQLMSGQTAAFLRSYLAAQTQAPRASRESMVRLCSKSNASIASNLTAWSRNNDHYNPFFDSLKAACKNATAENVWKVYSIIQDDDNFQMGGIGWKDWGNSEADFEEFRQSIDAAYRSTYKSKGKNDWDDVAQARMVLRFYDSILDPLVPTAVDAYKEFRARLNFVARTLAQ